MCVVSHRNGSCICIYMMRNLYYTTNLLCKLMVAYNLGMQAMLRHICACDIYGFCLLRIQGRYASYGTTYYYACDMVFVCLGYKLGVHMCMLCGDILTYACDAVCALLRIHTS